MQIEYIAPKIVPLERIPLKTKYGIDTLACNTDVDFGDAVFLVSNIQTEFFNSFWGVAGRPNNISRWDCEIGGKVFLAEREVKSFAPYKCAIEGVTGYIRLYMTQRCKTKTKSLILVNGTGDNEGV